MSRSGGESIEPATTQRAAQRQQAQARTVLAQCRQRHSITKVPERWRADWTDIAEIAKIVDSAGFEFILPIARWKGFGDEMDVRTLCFETFTLAAALGAITEQITIFATVHVPVVHPVFAAKVLVTARSRHLLRRAGLRNS